jgi:hypothetical protein
MPEDTQNPEALAHAQEALAAAEAQAKTAAKIKSTTITLTRPAGIGGVDYPKGTHAVPDAALEADQHFIDALEADGELSYAKETAADGAPRTAKATGATTPARKR